MWVMMGMKGHQKWASDETKRSCGYGLMGLHEKYDGCGVMGMNGCGAQREKWWWMMGAHAVDGVTT